MKRASFNQLGLPVWLLLPQLVVIGVFFYWPAAFALRSSFYLEDPFGFGSTFVGLDNYKGLLASAQYVKVAVFTLGFTFLVTFFSLSIALVLAVKADKVIRGTRTYR
ncbi:MAG: glycerol-3-phosphate ABC transporter permease, partial [Hoeflea sp.]|nr:glycerol-3-phosphate ABC transporter permease [Hoeflea sp.]